MKISSKGVKVIYRTTGNSSLTACYFHLQTTVHDKNHHRFFHFLKNVFIVRYISFENPKYLVDKELLELEKRTQCIAKWRKKEGRNHWVQELTCRKLSGNKLFICTIIILLTVSLPWSLLKFFIDGTHHNILSYI